MATLSINTMSTWLTRTNDELIRAWGNGLAHIQFGNVKTGAIGEGTSAVLTCNHGEWRDFSPAGIERGIKLGKIPPCARTCYAWRQMIQYPAYRAAMLKNTLLRRADPVLYYTTFAKAAVKDGSNRVRLNESGDFETREQVRAAFAVARRFPNVKFWGYTQRPAIWVMDAPANVIIRISCWTDAVKAARLEQAGFKTACVAVNHSTCPAQAAMTYNKEHNLKAGDKGFKAWHCADCAKRNCGCCGTCKRVVFKMH